MGLVIYDGNAYSPDFAPAPTTRPLYISDIGVIVAPVSAFLGATFTYVQTAASAFWIIQHNLGRYPAVSVVDSAGDEVEGSVIYVDSNQVTVAFSAPFSGNAYLN